MYLPDKLLLIFCKSSAVLITVYPCAIASASVMPVVIIEAEPASDPVFSTVIAAAFGEFAPSPVPITLSAFALIVPDLKPAAIAKLEEPPNSNVDAPTVAH